MLELESDDLSVVILDPANAEDRKRFGPRYCTGGYIFQIEDSRHGPLLTGPTYPDDFNWFDGQGIPDAFHQEPLRIPGRHDRERLILGIGVCDLEARSILEPCDWLITSDVNGGNRAIRFETHHRFEGIDTELVRTVSLSGRTVRSHTAISNGGEAMLPIRWFPHPFFPHPEQNELCKLNLPVALPANEGYELSKSGFISRRHWPWRDGYYLALDHRARGPVVILQRHPAIGLLTSTTDYTPSHFPIWGNPRTFSFEPFLERTIAPGISFSWNVDYDF